MSTVPGFGNFTLSIDNVDVSGRRDVLSTGGWQFWTPIRIEGVPLSAGVHIMRFDFDSDTDKTGWLFSLNAIDVEFVAPSGVADGAVPGAIARRSCTWITSGSGAVSRGKRTATGPSWRSAMSSIRSMSDASRGAHNTMPGKVRKYAMSNTPLCVGPS